MEEEKRGMKYDYVTIKPKEVILVLFWTAIIGLYFGRALYSYVYQVPFVRASCFQRNISDSSSYKLFLVYRTTL